MMYVIFGIFIAYVIVSAHLMESENAQIKKIGSRMYFGIIIVPMLLFFVTLFVLIYEMYGLAEIKKSLIELSPALILMVLSMIGAPKFVTYLEERSKQNKMDE